MTLIREITIYTAVDASFWCHFNWRWPTDFCSIFPPLCSFFFHTHFYMKNLPFVIFGYDKMSLELLNTFEISVVVVFFSGLIWLFYGSVKEKDCWIRTTICNITIFWYKYRADWCFWYQYTICEQWKRSQVQKPIFQNE